MTSGTEKNRTYSYSCGTYTDISDLWQDAQNTM